MTDWPEIVREHGPLVWRTAYRLLNRDADAADCFQLTFLAAFKFASGETVQNWPAILTRFCTARALEMLRVRYRERDRYTALVEKPSGVADDPAEQATASELADRLEKALALIDPRQAEVFCLICLEGRSNLEVADGMKLTATHVGMLLHRARVALKEQLVVDHSQSEKP